MAEASEILFEMPSLGAGMEAGTVVTWHAGPGGTLRRGEVIADVETEKGVIEVEIFADVTVAELLVEPGVKVPVGTPLARLIPMGATAAIAAAADTAADTAAADTAAADTAAADTAAADTAAADTAAADTAAADTATADTAAADTAAAIAATTDTAAIAADTAATAADTATRRDVTRFAERLRATPAARRAAAAHGLDLGRISGHGRDGIILLRDVEHAAPAATPAARLHARELGVDLAAITGTGRHGVVRLEDLPHTPAPAVGTPTAPLDAVDPAARMRAAIASAMSLSKREIPHYYLTHTVELSAALAFLEAHNATRPPSARALPAALFLRAIALALRKHPELNAHWVDGRAVPRDTIDLGLAISLRGGGLVAPSIREADTLDLDALMAALTDLVERARSGTLRASTMAPGSLTVTSLGERGVDVVVPVILPPQVAMVGIGTITTRPWVVGDACLPRPVVTLSLAADHRVTDGHVGARFLARIASLLVPS